MCRSIKRLRVPEQAVTPEEIRAAALQFVRKVSGFHHPSSANQAAFDKAIAEISVSTQRLLEQLPAARAMNRDRKGATEHQPNEKPREPVASFTDRSAV